MVRGDMPPPLLDPDEGRRAPRGPFCIPLRTSMRPTLASLDCACGTIKPNGRTRLLGENVKIYTAYRKPTEHQSLQGWLVSPPPKVSHTSVVALFNSIAREAQLISCSGIALHLRQALVPGPSHYLMRRRAVEG